MKFSFLKFNWNLVTFTLLLSSLMVECKNKVKQENEEAESAQEEWQYIEKAWQHEFTMTVDPALGYVPRERLVQAEAYRNSLLSNPLNRTSNLVWTERGPTQVGGRTRAILIDNRDATGNTIFTGGVAGGIWKCTAFKSGNPVWAPVNDFMSNMAVTCMVQDPTNGNIMYAGTGEGWGNSDAVRGDGIFKSIDGGVTWNQLAATSAASSSDFSLVNDLAITSNGTLFAACRSALYCNRGGVFKSTDGGTTFVRSLGNMVSGCSDAFDYRGADLEIGPNGDVYVTTGYSSSSTNLLGKIYRSSFAGNGANVGNVGNWIDITPAGTWRRIDITVSQSNPLVIYALLCSTSSTIGGVRRSDDAGASWVTLSTPSWCDQGSSSADFSRTQAWYDLIISVDPTNPANVLAGGVDVMKSTNSGVSFAQLTQWASGCSGLPYVHADIHEIKFYPNSGSEIIVGCDGGIFYSNNGGTTWTEKNTGYRITQFYGADAHPSDLNFFLAGAQDNGTHKLTQAGLGASTKVVGGDGTFCHIDQTNGVVQTAQTTGNSIRYSRNSGASFSSVSGSTSSTGKFVNPTDYDDVLDVLYGAESANAYSLVTNLNAVTAPIYQVVSLTGLNGTQISALKADPNTPGTAWMVGSGGSFPVLVKVENANTNSPNMAGQFILSTLTSGSYVSSIDVEKGNSNHLLVTVSNYGVASVFESTNGGTSWTNIEGNLPDMPIRWGLFAPSTTYLTGTSTAGGILIATELGVWATSTVNGSSTNWVPVNSGLANVRTDMLKYRPIDNLVLAATHARGLFTTNLPTAPTSVNTVNNTKGFIKYISASPQLLLLTIGNLSSVKNMEVQIVDMNGRLVYKNNFNYGNTTLNIGRLSSGNYILKVYGNNKETYTQQFVK